MLPDAILELLRALPHSAVVSLTAPVGPGWLVSPRMTTLWHRRANWILARVQAGDAIWLPADPYITLRVAAGVVSGTPLMGENSLTVAYTAPDGRDKGVHAVYRHAPEDCPELWQQHQWAALSALTQLLREAPDGD